MVLAESLRSRKRWAWYCPMWFGLNRMSPGDRRSLREASRSPNLNWVMPLEPYGFFRVPVIIFGARYRIHS
jgi:hypothetical protein